MIRPTQLPIDVTVCAEDEQGRELSKVEFCAYILSVELVNDAGREKKITKFSNGCVLTQIINAQVIEQRRHPGRPLDS